MRERRQLDRAIAALALPALGALAADPLVSLVDTAWVGRLGADPLGILGIATTVLATLFFIFNFLAYGVTPLIGAALGRGDPAEAARVGGGAVVLALVAGVLASVLAIVLAPAIVSLMGAEEAITPGTITYLRIRALGMPAVLLILAGHGIYRGHQDTRTPFVVTAGFNAVNLVLDPLLIFTAGLGVEGAAIASVIAQWLGALWFAVLLMRTDGSRRLVSIAGVTWARIRPLMGASAALVIRTGSLLSVFAVATAVAARVGTTTLAAHQVAFQLWVFLALVVDALAIAGQAMIGPALASGDPPEARRIANRLLQLGVIAGLGLGALIGAFAPLLPGIFTDDPAVLESVRGVYWFIVVMQPLNAVVFVWDGVAIGASSFRFLAVSMVAAAAVSIGVLATVLPTNAGLSLIWWGLTALMFVRLATMIWWHRNGPIGVEAVAAAA